LEFIWPFVLKNEMIKNHFITWFPTVQMVIPYVTCLFWRMQPHFSIMFSNTLQWSKIPQLGPKLIPKPWHECLKQLETYNFRSRNWIWKFIHYEKWGDLQLTLQLGFWVAMTICNSLQLNVFLWACVLLDKLHEFQQMQFIVCATVYICNSITIMQEQLLCNSNATSLQLQW
jgi:hypothetical protein